MSKAIVELGEKLVHCSLNCEGINNNPRQGIIPRCLIPESRGGVNRCIVVGLNPGKCNVKEREYYLNNGIKFSSITDYFENEKLKDIPYFKKARGLITLLGFDGDILWTDLAKCECSGKNGSLPIQTLRVCINKFLRKEIELFKCTTIFALGNDAFKFCALSFPDHFIVGLPHPSGSYGNFHKLNKIVMADTQRFIKNINETRDDVGNYRAIQLSKM